MALQEWPIIIYFSSSSFRFPSNKKWKKRKSQVAKCCRCLTHSWWEVCSWLTVDEIYLRGFTAIKTTEMFMRWPVGLSATASTKLLCRTGHCYNQQTLQLLSTPPPFLNLLSLFWNYYWGKTVWFSLCLHRVRTA